MIKKQLYLTSLAMTMLLSMTAGKGHAQFTRSTFAMDGLSYRMQLNPALTPDQGYFNIPVLGGIGASAASNSLGTKDIIHVVENSSDADYFTKNAFINSLKAENKLQSNVTLDLLSFGWYKGKNFWNVNVTLKNDVGVTIPRRIFETMRDARGQATISWANYLAQQGGEKVTVNSYVETGLGFARPINEKLTVGGKVKVLFGAANLKLDVKKLNLQTQLTGVPEKADWSKMSLEELAAIKGSANIDVEASMEASMKGFELKDDEKGFVNDVKRGGSFGVAGMGLGMDLGATYKPIDGLTLSAALLDLGFISWNKGSSHIAASNIQQQYRFDSAHPNEAMDFRDLVSDGKAINFDMLQTKQQEGKSRTTSLYSTIVLGGEYQLPHTQLSFGLLSTTRFAKPTTQSELTLSTAYKVNRHIGVSLAYSMIQSSGKGLGVGLKLGPLMIATDYMYFGDNTKCVNALVGFTIPLGSHRQS